MKQERPKTGFRAIRDEVLSRIEDGVWRQGATLPTETQLAAEFDCARATVSRALRELAERGILDRRRRSGTRVAASPTRQARLEISLVRHSVEETGARYRHKLVRRETLAAPPWLAALGDFAAEAPMLHLVCMHFADGRPYQLEDRWISTEAVPGVADVDFAETGPNEWLLANIPYSEAEIAFSAVSATADEAAFLDTAVGAALMRTERITRFRSAPITFVRMTHHPGFRMKTRV